MSIVLKIILLPFSLLYFVGTAVRNFAYNNGLIRSKSYDFPNIVIGNLSVGGTGKTPHVEYLIRLLQSNYKLATLSRGYGRKTQGFRIADKEDTAATIGDEPFQMRQKFKKLTVAVDEDRCHGIETLRREKPAPEVILLDDAFQHRRLNGGLKILLTDYSRLYINDFLLPAGRLRESRIGARRADIIIVTKSPTVLSPLEIRRIESILKPKSYQKVFFSTFHYSELKPLNDKSKEQNLDLNSLSQMAVLMVTAIANPNNLELYLKRYAKYVNSLAYKDHHFFEHKDYELMLKKFDLLLGTKKCIIVTEKDAVKLDISRFENVPLYALPIEVKIHSKGDEFDQEIERYVRSYTKGR